MAIDPMTALSIGQSVMGFFDAQEKAKQQEIAYQQNRLAAATARDMKIQALNARAIQESERVAGAKLENAIKALEVSEAKVVAAGEAGVSGNSVDALYNDFVAQEERGKTVLSQNAEAMERQMALQRRGADAEAESRINSIRQGQQPSFMSAALSTAASATASYYSGLSDTEQDAFKAKFSIF